MNYLRYSCLAILAALIMLVNQASADANVLIIGSTHDSSKFFYRGTTAFSPSHTSIATYLENIISAADPGTVIVETRERYAIGTSTSGDTSYSFNLASWFHWPYPKGSETNRWADLRCDGGTNWDYVILIGDPYTIEFTPGLFAHGVAQIGNEVAKGSAETVLLMSWPSGSTSSVDHYKDVIYRAGRSGGYKVVPAGLAWQAEAPLSDNDAAYLAAATIYSRLYGANAKDTGYSYNNLLADTAFTTVTNNVGQPQYSGDFDFQNPYLFNTDSKRKIYFSSRGTSTESYFKGTIISAINRCNVDVTAYCPWNRVYPDDYDANGGDEPWTTWPVDTPTPIAFNDGRDGATAEWYKSYLVNSNYWDFAYGYRYHGNTWSQPVDDANDHFVAQLLNNDNELADRMMTQGDSARNMPVRTLWALFHKEFPAENPLLDGSGPHLNIYENEAVGTYMYTLYSGRCPLDAKPATPDKNWVARKIGYETAWQLGRCQTRAPGFKVMPTSASASNVTPTVSETLSVQFIFAPTSEVTVAVNSDDNYRGRASPSLLTFTPENYMNEQTVTVTGVSGSSGSFGFNVILTTSSDDEVYDGLSDSWDFINTRSAGPAPSDIRILGNGTTIDSGDTTPTFADDTDFRVVNVSTSKVFTIENLSSSTTINLTDTPAVTITDSTGYFSLNQDAASTLSPDSSTTFKIGYTPSAPGTHTATVNVASSDSAIPNYTFTIKAARASAPTASEPTAAPLGTGGATFSGSLIDGGICDAWICWGVNDGGTESTSDWDHAVSIGSMYQDVAFSANAEDLLYGVIYECRIYVTNFYGSDWSGLTNFSLSSPEKVFAANWDFETGDLQGWTNVGTTVGTDTLFRDGHEPVSGSRLSGKQGAYYIDGYVSNEGTSDAWTGIIESEDTFVLAPGAHLTMVSGGGTFTWSGTPDSPGTLAGVALEREASPGVWENIILQSGGNNSLTASDHDLSAYEGETCRLRIYDTTTGSWGWTAVDDISITAVTAGGAFAVSNSTVQNVTNTSAELTGVLDAENSVLNAYVYFSTNNNLTPSAWTNDTGAQSNFIGTYTNVASQSLSASMSSLSEGTAYYCTFMAENEATNIWAASNMVFVTHGGPTYTLTYQAGPNGSISGTATQTVYAALGGTAVTAVPDSGYRFSSWSDSSTDNPRIDTVVSNDMAVTASFAVDPTIVVSRGATPSNTTSAVLSAEMTGGTSGSAWICWGGGDHGTASTSDWDHVVSMGPVTQSVQFSALVTDLSTNTTYFFRCYAVSGTGNDWSDVAAFSGISWQEPFATEWTPDDMTTALWLDASDASTVLLNGGAVSNWMDKSGNNRHAAQATSGNQPALTSGVMNGKDVVTFDGSTSFLNIDLDFLAGVSHSAFIVAKVSAFNNIYGAANADSGSNSLHVGFANDSSYRINYWGNDGSGTVSTNFQAGQGNLLNFIWPAGGSKQVFANGKSEVTSGPVAGAIGTMAGGGRICNIVGQGFFGGDIAEIIMLTGTVSADDRELLEGYLAHKWGLTSSLPGDHPYITTPPGGTGTVVANNMPENITASGATLSGTVDATGTNYDVYVYFGTSDGGSNSGSWADSGDLGQYSDVTTSVSHTVSGLIRGQTYYYTFRAGDLWASPTWQFKTPAGGVLTTNHLIPYAWIDAVATNVVTDYEAEVMDDPDGDGFTTWEEYWSGTDPNDADSFLKIDSVVFSGSNVEIEWRHEGVDVGIPAITIECTTNLLTGLWEVAGEKIPTNGANIFSETAFQRLYYRLAQTNAPD